MACQRKFFCAALDTAETDYIQCCSPLENGDGGWGIFNSLFGWQNSATYGSVISYNLYWVAVIAGFVFLGWKEGKEGTTHVADTESEKSIGHHDLAGNKAPTGTAVREVE